MSVNPKLEQVAREHSTDPNYEVNWESISDLLRLGDPLQDQLTLLIDQLSMNERELIRNAMAYKSAFSEDYKSSRTEWLSTAKMLRGRDLTPDEVIPLANKHRIYFAITHPRGMNLSIHNQLEEDAVCNLLWKVTKVLGPEKCRVLGYHFDEAA